MPSSCDNLLSVTNLSHKTSIDLPRLTELGLTPIASPIDSR